MFIYNQNSYTNTPVPLAGYVTSVYQAPQNAWYRHTPVYYTDQYGQIKQWIEWNRPQGIPLEGTLTTGTPTRTMGYSARNTTF